MLPLLRIHARRQRHSAQQLLLAAQQAASRLARQQQPDGGASSGRRCCERMIWHGGLPALRNAQLRDALSRAVGKPQPR
jgi:hypothetical protein